MSERHFDVVIIGAGSAGCVLAARLSEDPAVEVALLEAGQATATPAIHDPAAWASLQGTEVDWQFETLAQDGLAGRAHPWPRGRCVGGSSAINAMAHVRGHASDFDAWERQGATGWDATSLLPCFRRAETSPFGPSPYHGDDGPIHLIQPDHPHPITQAFRAAAEERGLAPIRDHNGPQMAGPTVNTLTIRNGRRQTVADAYLDPSTRRRANLTILTERLVDRIEPDAHGRLRRVQGAHGGVPETWVADEALILAAGAIGSPSILLRSGIGPVDDLRTVGVSPRLDLPGVGANLQDHLLAAGNVYRASQTVGPSRYQHSESLCYIQAGSGDQAPAYVVAAVVLPVITESFPAIEPGRAYTLMFGQTHPASRGRLRLVSADPTVAPEIDPNYLAVAADRQAMREALAWAREIGSAPALDSWRADEVLPPSSSLESERSIDRFIAQAAATHHHPAGTCRMGDDPLAVTGPDLAVRGAPGLYVVDASVMPSLTTGPINAAVVAIAERAASMISSSLAV